MTQDPYNTDDKRRARAEKLHALQTLRDDYEVMLLDARLRRHELRSRLDGARTAGAALPATILNRKHALSAYYDQLIGALEFNLAAIASRTTEIQKGVVPLAHGDQE